MSLVQKHFGMAARDGSVLRKTMTKGELIDAIEKYFGMTAKLSKERDLTCLSFQSPIGINLFKIYILYAGYLNSWCINHIDANDLLQSGILIETTIPTGVKNGNENKPEGNT